MGNNTLGYLSSNCWVLTNSTGWELACKRWMVSCHEQWSLTSDGRVFLPWENKKTCTMQMWIFCGSNRSMLHNGLSTNLQFLIHTSQNVKIHELKFHPALKRCECAYISAHPTVRSQFCCCCHKFLPIFGSQYGTNLTEFLHISTSWGSIYQTWNRLSQIQGALANTSTIPVRILDIRQDFTSDSQILVSFHGSHRSKMIHFTIRSTEKYTCGNSTNENKSQANLSILVRHVLLDQQLEKEEWWRKKISLICAHVYFFKKENLKPVKDRNIPLFFNDRKADNQ